MTKTKSQTYNNKRCAVMNKHYWVRQKKAGHNCQDSGYIRGGKTPFTIFGQDRQRRDSVQNIWRRDSRFYGRDRWRFYGRDQWRRATCSHVRTGPSRTFGGETPGFTDKTNGMRTYMYNMLERDRWQNMFGRNRWKQNSMMDG